MFSDTPKNQVCEFAEETMSYLYGEISAGAAAKIETHLSKCALCADDAAAFTVVRSAIKDWKTADFDRLTLPAIVISQPETVQSANGSLLESIKDYFAFPARLRAASVAALVIFAGSLFLFYNQPAEKSVAENFDGAADRAFVSPDADSAEKHFTPDEEAVEEKGAEIEKAKTPKIKFDFSENSPAIKKSVSPENARRVAAIAGKTNSAKRRRANDFPRRSVKPPTLADSTEDDEDDSLRLASILDEISMR